jgi:ATPase family associated with various cellular activities (AAA)
MTKTLTRGQRAAADVAALLRARNPLIWVVTREEGRAEALLFEAAASANYIAHTWDVAQGAAELDGRKMQVGGRDPGEMLEAIQSRSMTGTNRDVWIMRDLPVWLIGPGAATTLRQLRNLARSLPAVPRERAQAVIVLSPSGVVPDELTNHATVIEWPLPDREEIAAIVDTAVASLPDEIRAGAAPNGQRDAVIDAAIGLTGEEAASCYARSLVQTRKLDPALVASEKRRVIAREGVLEWIDPLPGGIDAVGGLDQLKAWLMARKLAYSPKAREYGLPAPKGALLVGVPGCGKTLTPKAIATAWTVPLLRFDFGALKSKYVGESEGRLRKTFRVIEAMGRCVVWIDEIEKALAGATQGAADGGVSSDALGAFLGWMQDRAGEAFVIATANSVEALPPELLRKGRFDEIWFVDLPNLTERGEVLRAALRAHGRAPNCVDVSLVAMRCVDFTGSEIAALVPEALFAAFSQDARAIVTEDLLQAARNVTPLAKTSAEKINKLRQWSNGRARYATGTTTGDSSPSRRVLDI